VAEFEAPRDLTHNRGLIENPDAFAPAQGLAEL
jgi:hypothetical protein